MYFTKTFQDPVTIHHQKLAPTNQNCIKDKKNLSKTTLTNFVFLFRTSKGLAIANTDFFELFKSRKYINDKYRDAVRVLTVDIVPDVEKQLREFDKNLNS